ncbi:glycosyltransferase family 4 protein [Haloferax volcanii]|uniref:Glycosyltransferase family 4 protein n=1 Tax=Haloferax volcanii TaxID=2246 RepID=A0A558G9I7_HALVO|nr:glycosyltransferase family 4 protein [Haloferax volcanii]TVT94428.1 glycosyltransferase family 4 protein [Haloferax volcanii]
MKIAVHSSHYPYPEHKERYISGGGEKVARLVSEGLVEKGHEVTVYTASNGSPSQSIHNGVRVVRYRRMGSIGRTSVAPKQFVPEFDDADVIHIHNTTPPGVFSGLLHSYTSGSPAILTHHGTDRYVPEGSIIKRTLNYLYAEVFLEPILSNVDAITIPTTAYLSESPTIEKYRGKVIEVPNGISTEKYYNPELGNKADEIFNICSDNFVVAFIGDLIPKKGPDMLVEVADQFDQVSFIIAGDGPMIDKLRQRAPKNTKIPGYISDEEKIALLNRADAFCLPSRNHTEVFPLVFLEAFAAGTPVITSDLGTFDNIVTQDVGVRFQRGNKSGLSSCIHQLANSQQEKDRLSAAAKKNQKNTGGQVL